MNGDEESWGRESWGKLELKLQLGCVRWGNGAKSLNFGLILVILRL